jgi:hypothetical protein
MIEPDLFPQCESAANKELERMLETSIAKISEEIRVLSAGLGLSISQPLDNPESESEDNIRNIQFLKAKQVEYKMDISKLRGLIEKHKKVIGDLFDGKVRFPALHILLFVICKPNRIFRTRTRRWSKE